MFKLDSNQSIRLSKGDDVSIPLFINGGTVIDPLRYRFAENRGCSVYFSIYNLNDVEDAHALLAYEYKDDNTISVYKNNLFDRQIKSVSNINDNGDMIVRLFSDDTKLLATEEYRYKIQARLLDMSSETKRYILVTVTNKLPLYIVNDDFAYKNWSE